MICNQQAASSSLAIGSKLQAVSLMGYGFLRYNLASTTTMIITIRIVRDGG